MGPKNILVTGGCGFIGSHFIEHTLNAYPDARVTCLDTLTYAAHPDTVKYVAELAPERYQFVRADIASPAAAEVIKNGAFDAIVNFAAETHVDRSILDPAAFVRTNVLGLQNLMDAARAAGGVRFVHVSTDEVYGTLSPTDPLSTETSGLDPNSPYAASKASADLMALAACRTFKQPVLITRCTNNYGPFQFPEKLLPLVIANAIEDASIPIYGDGKQVRDWIYVGDHARGVDAVLRHGRSGQIYNISANEEKHNIDLVKKVLGILGKPESLIKYVGDRPAHDRRYALDSSLIRRELGWAPSLTFEQGIAKTVNWYLENEGWWKKVRDKEYFAYYQANYDGKFQGAKEGGRV
jgi:dTDP-glucose 4,6-dehydratase